MFVVGSLPSLPEETSEAGSAAIRQVFLPPGRPFPLTAPTFDPTAPPPLDDRLAFDTSPFPLPKRLKTIMEHQGLDKSCVTTLVNVANSI